MLKWIIAFFTKLWDPDYTRVTPAEPDELEAIAEAKADTSPTVPHSAINWD